MSKISQTFKGIAIEDESLSGKAAMLIRSKIIQGILEPGERLNESDLSQALGISRACVRGALQTLEFEGLVKKRANKYTEVIVLTLQDVEEIYRLRAAIECCCAETALQKQLLPFERLEMEATAISHQHQIDKTHAGMNLWIDEDFAFHEMIVVSSQNKRAIQAWRRLKSQAILVLYNAIRHHWNAEIIGDHRSLVNVFKDESMPVVLEKLKAHIMEGYLGFQEIIKKNGHDE